VSSQKVTSYALSQNMNFNSWILESSNDGVQWTTLHIGSQGFSGRQSFDIINNAYYTYYRVRVTRWIPGAIREIAEVEFYAKSSDITSQTTSYTTTTTLTTTTLSSTSGSTTFTTLTTRTTVSTTVPPPCVQPGFLNITEMPLGYRLDWEAISNVGYELEVRYNNDYYYQPLASCGINTYTIPTVDSSVVSIQFRVRSTTRTSVSPWTLSEVLLIRKPIAAFKAISGSQQSENELKLVTTGEVDFIDMSVPQGSPIVSRVWKFYSTPNVSSSFEISNDTNPVRTYSTGVFAVSLTVTDQRGRYSTLIKTSFILVGCDLTVDFSAEIQGFPEQLTSLTAAPLQVMTFNDKTTGGDVVSWSWRFYKDAFGLGQYIESTLRNPPFRYDTIGSYAVGLVVTGLYGQTDSKIKSSFIRVVTGGSSSSSSSTTTTTGSTTTLTSTTRTSTSPPVNWWRISQDGFPIADSFKVGYEPYRAFDRDINTRWEPDVPDLTESSTTLTSTISSTSISTTESFMSHKKPGPLWQKTTDVKDFRDRFIDLSVSDNIYRIIRFDRLPIYKILIHEGTIVYDNFTEKFYVGVNGQWSPLNPAQIPHAYMHGSGGSDPLVVVSSQAPTNPFLGEIWIDTTGDQTTATTASTTATSTTAYNGNIAVPGPWGHGECSSYIEGNPCSLAFDSNGETFWQALNTISSTEAATEKQSVNHRGFITPPTSPSIGDRYIVGVEATGLWQGKNNQIAEWDGSWQYDIPNVGDYCYVIDEDNTFTFSGTTWQPREEWIGYYWTDRRVIRVYRLLRLKGQGIPSSWRLEASRNGLVWMNIHSVRDAWVGMSEYDISNSTDFNYYRLYIDETHDGNPPRLASLEFFEGPPKE
jgi:PKD repeat protein